MKGKLTTYIKNTIEILKDAETKLINNKTHSITIDQKYFDNTFMHTVNISEHLQELKGLKDIKKPVLYWFELMSSKNNKAIREKYIGYREPLKKDFKSPYYRNTSSYKSKYDSNSKILYVGKVEKGFWGRLVTHLGYNQSIKTAGMQLNHWYNPTLFGNIKLNYIEFDEDMKHLIIILEKKLANHLKPLIGRY